ncbi:MAG: class I SAM-dependent methyltransferase, partial [Patescibacteria group bacterium]|nr:class I SAM-dependent methyltransferase [Patescibacteria group bacterium]
MAILKDKVATLLEVISGARVRVAPSFFAKPEQWFWERKIEVMHNHPGYAQFSAVLRDHIPDGIRVLDVGCNRGLETAIIAKTNSVVGVDLYANFVKAANRRGIDAVLFQI